MLHPHSKSVVADVLIYDSTSSPAPASTLAETATHCVELKIFRCRLKHDAQLG